MLKQLTITHKILILLFVPILWIFLEWYGFLPTGNFPATRSAGYQAVFLSNNQTYFGKLENYNYGYVKLTDVYYLRAGGNLQEGAAAESQNISLVKLGGELHGPEDVMYIRKDSIMFWENLKETARVVGLIRGAH